MNDVVRALLYLRLMTIRNAIVSRILRLKQPKYLFGALAGIAYFYFAVFRRMRMNQQVATAAAGFNSEQSAIAATVLAILFMIVILLYWIWPRKRAALTFTEAEIAFLFPAPISQRALIHYRLINLFAGLLFTSFIFSLFSGGTGFLSANGLIRFCGWWIILVAVSLHSIASSFAITSLLDRGITSLRRQLLVLAGAVSIIAAFAFFSFHKLPAPQPGDLIDIGAMTHYLATLFATAPLSWLLAPATWIIRPALASNMASFLIALGPALLLLSVHYIWVMRAEVSFADASIAKAEKRAAKVAAMRAGKLRIGSGTLKVKAPPFNLSAVRRPELAFLWKNLLSSAPYLRLRTTLIAVAVIIIGCHWITSSVDFTASRLIVAIFSSVFAGYVLLLGPMVARQDLRNDLLNTDILKTYPLRGWQVILGEILAPTAILTVIFWLLFLTAALTLQTDKIKWLTPAIQLNAALAIALVAPLLCVIQLLILNTAAILFPAWMQTNQSGPGGVEVMGQRLLFVAGLLLAIMLALLPAALFAALIYLLTGWLLGTAIATALATLVIIIILVVEIVFSIEWLGEKFEEFDLSAELRS